jgi:hypothetical protein
MQQPQQQQLLHKVHQVKNLILETVLRLTFEK